MTKGQEAVDGRAVASLVLGIVGLMAWCIPLLGVILTAIGLSLGMKSRDSASRGMAIAGIVLCSIGLAAAVVAWVVSVYLSASGTLG